MSARSAVRRGRAALGPSSDSPGLDAELLLCHALQCPRYAIHAHPERTLGGAELACFDALLARRHRGEPLAYILGTKEFWSLAIRVGPEVLIPRPETELLVELALARIPRHRPWRIADLGTGSGAIALALAQERPRAQLVATDIDPAALAVAADNAERLRLDNVRFLGGDWLAPLFGQRFALIVSNPPYVAYADRHLQTPELRHEPRHALTAGPNGLDALQRIIEQAPQALHARGTLILEHSPEQTAAVRDLLAQHGFDGIDTHRDLPGHERATLGSSARTNQPHCDADRELNVKQVC